METLQELFERLNQTNECVNIEAKKASEMGRAVLETVCAFSNEPSLGGGYLLLGVEMEENSLFPTYVISGVPKDRLDKIQSDLASQCAESFNIPIRPQIRVDINSSGAAVIIAFISELAPEQKPLYFKNIGLPQGAFRRIGSTDQRCTEDDLAIFYQTTDSLDNAIIKDANLDDLSEDAITLYRRLRGNVNPTAEELSYSDNDLLRSLNAVKKSSNDYQITYTGLLCFGSRIGLRRLLPMVRVDYIRVSTNEWIGDADKRFESTLDMRGSLLELVQRIISTISDDLPKGFILTEDNIQAKNIGLPMRVLREAVVNALIHRSYRDNTPIQVIRYPNRIEIINPGFSLKTEEQLGEPGSVSRNPFIAAIFHETNLAETKGSGVRTMRSLMEKVNMMPPTFESSREHNKFTVRLLLHHLLNEEDINWLNSLSRYDLNDNQKRTLIFIREVNAIDNSTARQINGSDSITTNSDLRKLRDSNLLVQKGKNKFTYYVASPILTALINGEKTVLSAPPQTLSALPKTPSAPPQTLSALPKTPSAPPQTLSAPPFIQDKIILIGKRVKSKEIISEVILDLCEWKPLKIKEISKLIGKSEKHLLRGYIQPLLKEKRLQYTVPDMINHPEQAYKTVNKLI